MNTGEENKGGLNWFLSAVRVNIKKSRATALEIEVGEGPDAYRYKTEGDGCEYSIGRILAEDYEKFFKIGFDVPPESKELLKLLDEAMGRYNARFIEPEVGSRPVYTTDETEADEKAVEVHQLKEEITALRSERNAATARTEQLEKDLGDTLKQFHNTQEENLALSAKIKELETWKAGASQWPPMVDAANKRVKQLEEDATRTQDHCRKLADANDHLKTCLLQLEEKVSTLKAALEVSRAETENARRRSDVIGDGLKKVYEEWLLSYPDLLPGLFREHGYAAFKAGWEAAQ